MHCNRRPTFKGVLAIIGASWVGYGGLMGELEDTLIREASSNSALNIGCCQGDSYICARLEWMQAQL